MIFLRTVLILLCILSITSARPASMIRAIGKRNGASARGIVPIKIKRQTDDLHRRLIGIDPSHYGEHFSPEENSDESLLLLRKKASIAEMFRHRLMACGLITTKSPERWRDRLLAELDEIVTAIEHRCALCKSLYDEPYRYDVLKSLIDPCPDCCRRKTNKQRLLHTLQKVLEKSLDSENVPNESSVGVEEENEGHDSNIWAITEIPKSRKTRSTTETSIPLTTQAIVSVRAEDDPRVSETAAKDYQLKPSWWSHHPTTQSKESLPTAETKSSVNETNVPQNGGESEPSTVHVINGQPVDNVHDFLQQYMNLVYGGQPGNEQRKQFFLDQLCRNATNGRIVLQCNDVTGQRKTRFASAKSEATEKVSAWNAGEDSNASSNVQKSLLFTTPSLNVVKPKVIGCHPCWTLGRKRSQWDGH